MSHLEDRVSIVVPADRQHCEVAFLAAPRTGRRRRLFQMVRIEVVERQADRRAIPVAVDVPASPGTSP
jgi:hypothetical protein